MTCWRLAVFPPPSSRSETCGCEEWLLLQQWWPWSACPAPRLLWWRAENIWQCNINILDGLLSYLEMSGGDSLHLQVLGGVACQLQDLSSEVLQDSGAIDCSCGANTENYFNNYNNHVCYSWSHRPLAKLLLFRCLWILPTGNWSPALADRDTAFCLDFPESLPALPPAIVILYC